MSNIKHHTDVPTYIHDARKKRSTKKNAMWDERRYRIKYRARITRLANVAARASCDSQNSITIAMHVQQVPIYPSLPQKHFKVTKLH